MEPTKKPKVKIFTTWSTKKQEKEINEFLSQHESISIKSSACDHGNVWLLYEE